MGDVSSPESVGAGLKDMHNKYVGVKKEEDQFVALSIKNDLFKIHHRVVLIDVYLSKVFMPCARL